MFDSSALQMSVSDHVSTACSFGSQMASNNKWTIAGEWTGAMTDCAKWLNGRNIGARYDGTMVDSEYIGSCNGYSSGTVNGLSKTAKGNIGRFIQAQMSAFEEADGWIFWTWKTEAGKLVLPRHFAITDRGMIAPEWDYQALTNAGVIPYLDAVGVYSSLSKPHYPSTDNLPDTSVCGGGG